jgi:ABC-type polysaccharide/polyol phosphate transport system ATPase subunit/SAM-dependent methyltransferase
VNDIAIRVTDLIKDYEVYDKPLDLALEVLTRRTRHKTFRALDGISFEVGRGEVLGIIGSNGAGKSTLLKIITGVLDATDGLVHIAGRVTAILELGLGFNPEYSGRENIYLSGLLYGMDKAEVDRKIDGIVLFSGLGEFIDRSVKTYSSGMHSRLAFSIATAVDPDILIIDEALAAGDAAFVQKCLRRIRQLCSSGRTVLLVSHGTGLLAQLCHRVMWMEHGRVRMIGSAMQVIQAYDLTAHQAVDAASWIETIEDDLAISVEEGAPAAEPLAKIPIPDSGRACAGIVEMPEAGSAVVAERDPRRLAAAPAPASAVLRTLFQQGGETGRQVFRRGPVFIDSVELLDAREKRTTRLTLLEPFTLKVHYHVDGPLPNSTLGLAVAVNSRHDLAPAAQFMTQNIRPFETRESYEHAMDRFKAARRGTLVVAFDYVPFRKGEYVLSLGLLPNEPATWEFYEYRHFYYSFSVDDAGMDVGAPILLNPVLTHVAESKRERATASKSTTPSAQAFVGAGRATLRGEIERICVVEGGYPEHWPRHQHCPSCGEGPLVDAFAKYSFSHVRCGTCGFICVDPYPTDEILTKLYSSAYYSRIRELFERPLLERGGTGTPFSAPREVLQAIVRRATGDRKAGSWLDVGGGLGAFAHLIRTLRPYWEVKLNELNPQSIAIARELFDFEVVTGNPEELLREGRRFHVVSSVSVLEHIPLPLNFLRSYAGLVEPGGWLVTVVPHFSPMNAFVSHGASANAAPPYHVSLFNENALRRLLARIEGLETVAVEQAGAPTFELIHHVDFGDCWDIEIPTPEHPEPRSVLLAPYDPQTARLLSVLSKADKEMGNYFAERDGRLYLIAYCRKRTS